MSFKYEVICTIDIGKSIAEVGAVLNGINSELAKFGIDEKLIYGSSFKWATITTDRNMNSEEIANMEDIIDDHLKNNQVLSQYGIRVESIRCQSSQSSSQSQ
jgi:hypothetical protein